MVLHHGGRPPSDFICPFFLFVFLFYLSLFFLCFFLFVVLAKTIRKFLPDLPFPHQDQQSYVTNGLGPIDLKNPQRRSPPNRDSSDIPRLDSGRGTPRVVSTEISDLIGKEFSTPSEPDQAPGGLPSSRKRKASIGLIRSDDDDGGSLRHE